MRAQPRSTTEGSAGFVVRYGWPLWASLGAWVLTWSAASSTLIRGGGRPLVGWDAVLWGLVVGVACLPGPWGAWRYSLRIEVLADRLRVWRPLVPGVRVFERRDLLAPSVTTEVGRILTMPLAKGGRLHVESTAVNFDRLVAELGLEAEA